MSCKRGQSSLLGLPSAADIMKRATCFMRVNAPCGVKGVMGYALSARGIFAQAQICRMYQSRSTFPQGAALGYGQHLGLQPAPTRLLAQTLSFLIKPRGILSSKMTKPRGKTLVFLTKPRGMNDFVKPNEQSSSLLEYSAMARNRTFKKDTLYAFFLPRKTLHSFISSAI